MSKFFAKVKNNRVLDTIVADKNLVAGHIIKDIDIWARSPGNGEIPAEKFDDLIGRRLKKDIKYNTQLKWEDFIDED